MQHRNKNKKLAAQPLWRYNSVMMAMALSSVSSYTVAQDLIFDEPATLLNLNASSATSHSSSASSHSMSLSPTSLSLNTQLPPILAASTTSQHQQQSPSQVSTSVQALTPMHTVSSETVIEHQYQQPSAQRMSAWLMEQKQQQPLAQDYQPALMWQSQHEKSHQAQQQQQLHQQLNEFATSHQAVQPLVSWLTQLPATGRVVLPKQDTRYLEIHPQLDPMLEQGDSVKRYARPHEVTVLFDNAQICRVQHQAGVHARVYLESCQTHLQQSQSIDEGYLISPDGTIQHITLATWNAKAQQAPVPGSWLWLPNKKNGWSKQLSQDVAKILATQGMDLALPQGQDATVIALKSDKTTYTARDLPTSHSDWGVTGLLQTPTARMKTQGSAGIHVAHMQPYTQYNIHLQPFNWLETAVRYTNIDGVSYGAVSPNQDYKDKSFDVKLRLWKERKWVPEVAVGWRDPAGTSLFGGEYVVANKRYGDFDMSLGMGWGYLGARGDIENPLGDKTRVAKEIGQGGTVSPKTWFSGAASLFGGVQWHSPYQPLTVKVEYDGNDYKKDRANRGNQKIDAEQPINVGVTWQRNGLELSAGVERGNTAMFAVALNGDLSQLGQVKNTVSTQQQSTATKQHSFKPSSLSYQIPLSRQVPEHQPNAPLLNQFSQATGWKAYKLQEQDGVLTLFAEDDGGVFLHERLVRAGEILTNVMPNHRLMQIELTRHGETISRFKITPDVWQAQYQQLLPESKRLAQPFTISSEISHTPTANVVAERPVSRGYLSFAPTFSQSIGGPNGYLFGVYATANANYRLWQGSWLNATAQVRLADNFDKFTYTANSQLPRVRTNVRDYMTSSRVLMPNLQWTQFKQLGNNLYGLAYAGYLDPMFAGVGGEVLYRPAQGRWAIGADINQVRQRDFKQDFALQDYDVTTGHVNFYVDLPYDVTAKVSAGQYLAGDKGATLDLSRTFKNGVKMGAWATKTNVSAEVFGEGSMDKGIYVSIPFDALFRGWSAGRTSLVYQPLIRDGGAKLSRLYTLYDLTSAGGQQAITIRNPKE